MASTSETGHEKNVENFGGLVEQAKSMGTKYKPSNPLIALAALGTKRDEGRAVIKTWKEVFGVTTNRITSRSIAYKNMGKLSTRIMKALKGSGAEKEEIDNAKTWHMKITGQRLEKPEAPKEGEKGGKSNSSSQMGFIMRKGNFGKLVEVIKNISAYNPNEDDLKVATLTAYLGSLELLNDNTNEGGTDLERAIDARNEVLYKEKTGIYDLATAIKNYIYSVDGTDGPVSKKVSKIKFTKLRP